MTPQQKENALAGLQDRINRIARRYKFEVRRNHRTEFIKAKQK